MGFVTIDIKVEVFVPEPPFYNLCFLKFIQIKDVWLIQLGFHNYFILKRYRFLTTCLHGVHQTLAIYCLGTSGLQIFQYCSWIICMF